MWQRWKSWLWSSSSVSSASVRTTTPSSYSALSTVASTITLDDGSNLNPVETVGTSLVADAVDEDVPPALSSRLMWVPTGPELLQFWEKRILRVVKTPFRQMMVNAGPFKINTLVISRSQVENSDAVTTTTSTAEAAPNMTSSSAILDNDESAPAIADSNNGGKPALVMVHGFGGGIGFWTCNLDELSRKYDIYAFDLVGFGRSSRSDLRFKNEQEAITFFVDSIEHWRKAMGLNKLVLMGHSLGAYLAADFAMKYPRYLSHVILVDPFGIPQSPSESDLAKRKVPLRYRILAKLIALGNPLYMIRLFGPWGLNIVQKMRPDFVERFKHLYQSDNQSVISYIYHLNAQSPATGERAFKHLSLPFGYAKLPLCFRIPKEWDRRVPLTFIYGAQSWMDYSAASRLREEMQDHPNVDIFVLPNAGHHCYADNYEEFNRIVNQIATTLPQQQEPH